MKKYEIMFILSTQIDEEARKVSISYVEELLSKDGAKEISTEILGEKKLAYPVNKKEYGVYVLTKFEIEGTKLMDIERRLNIYENIMKYIIVKL